MYHKTKRQSYRVFTDKLDSSKKNTKKKWNNVHLQNYVAISTILDQFSGHFTDIFWFRGHFIMSIPVVPPRARKAGNDEVIYLREH